MEPQNTSLESKTSEQVDAGIFSHSTRSQALSLIRKRHSISFLWPIRDGIEWILGLPVDPAWYAHVIDARKQFNQAANDAVAPEEKKAA